MILRVLLSISVAQAQHYYGDDKNPHRRKDVFDEVKSGQGKRQNLANKQPECPTADGLSPFSSLAFVDGEIYIRRTLEDDNPKCEKLIEIATHNTTALMKAGKACGPVGEWKRRIASNLFAVFWSGGLDGWPTGEEKTMFIKTDSFIGEIELSPEKFERLEACWMEGCGCEQAQSPGMRIFFAICLILCLMGLGYDSLSLVNGKKKKKKERDPEKEAKKKEKKEKKKEKKEKKDDDAQVGGDEAKQPKSGEESADSS